MNRETRRRKNRYIGDLKRKAREIFRSEDRSLLMYYLRLIESAQKDQD